MAQDQARSARQSAEAAAISAHAIVDQARSGRESVRLMQAEHDRADRPDFEFKVERVLPGRVSVQAKMISGPSALKVIVDWTGESFMPFSANSREVRIHHGGGLGEYSVIRDQWFGFPVELPAEAERAEFELTLHCVDSTDEARTWPYRRSVQWNSYAQP